MGVYNSALITTTNWEDRISSIVNYLNGIEGITAAQERIIISNKEYLGAKFIFDNKGIEGFYGYESTMRSSGVYLKNTNIDADLIIPQAGGNDYQASTNMKIQHYLDDDVMLVSIGDMMGGYRLKLTIAFVNTADSISLFGYGLSSALNSIGDPLIDIASLTFNILDDSARIPYAYVNMYPYMATAGTLEYCNEAFFANGGIKNFSTDALKECSTVAMQSTQSLLSGICVALGAHCLAPLDTEE